MWLKLLEYSFLEHLFSENGSGGGRGMGSGVKGWVVRGVGSGEGWDNSTNFWRMVDCEWKQRGNGVEHTYLYYIWKININFYLSKLKHGDYKINGDFYSMKLTLQQEENILCYC